MHAHLHPHVTCTERRCTHAYAQVSYTISVAGIYLLHVRLRQGRAPVPGSPFLLTVVPGEPYARSTSLHVDGSGETGQWLCASIRAKDATGNVVMVGGCQIACACTGGTEVEVSDNGDGSYDLRVTSLRPGTFELSAMIGTLHLIGSPAKVNLTLPPPTPLPP